MLPADIHVELMRVITHAYKALLQHASMHTLHRRKKYSWHGSAQHAESLNVCGEQSYSFGLFAECYQCPPKNPMTGLWG